MDEEGAGGAVRRSRRAASSSAGVRTHVFIVDGTMSRLEPGHETNAGLLWRLLAEAGPRRDRTLGYHPGIQGTGLTRLLTIAAGLGINLAIAQGYATLASRYRPGDRIMLFGYSRGAYAVRSLAGFIGRIGLVRRGFATERLIAQAFRHYQNERLGVHGRLFRRRHCHGRVPIEVLGVWDTVAALGLPYPMLSRLAPMATDFHDAGLSHNVRNAFQALALDEDRAAYAPLPWRLDPGWRGRAEQVWFAGAHGDVGGHVWAFPAARPLSNIPLRWMLGRAEACGLALPDRWELRFPIDPAAPAQGCRSGSARLFRHRVPRLAGVSPTETIHSSVEARMAALPQYAPRAQWNYSAARADGGVMAVQ